MAEDAPDPWRSVVEITAAAAAARDAHPDLAARLHTARSRFGGADAGVSGLLDDVDRRANIDVDAPVDSSRPVVPHLKSAVRKAGAFVARHLAQQTTVLVGGLSAALRELDQRVQRLEADAHAGASVLAAVPDGRAEADAVLADVAGRGDGPRRDVGSPEELHTLPRADAGLVVGYRIVDVGPLGQRLEVLDRLIAAVAPGGTLAIVATDTTTWAEHVDPVLRDLAGPGPLHPATWAHLLTERGAAQVEQHLGRASHVIVSRW